MGFQELLIIGLVVFLLFGGAQLPKLAKSLGGFMAEFDKAKETAEKTVKKTSKKKTK